MSQGLLEVGARPDPVNDPVALPASGRRRRTWRVPVPVALGCVAFALAALVVVPMRGSIFQYDEAGYLINARFLAGEDLRSGFAFLPGYSLLLVPAFVLFDGLREYQAALVTNAALFAGGIVAAWWVLRELRPDLRAAAPLAGVAGLYAGWLLYVPHAMSETLLTSMVLVVAGLVGRAAGSARRWPWVATGSLAGFGVGVHPRGVVVLLAAATTLGIALRHGRTSRRQALAGFAGATLGGAAVVALLRYVVVDDFPSYARARLIAGAARAAVTAAAAQGIYLSVATFGMVVVGCAVASRASVAFATGRSTTPADAIRAFAAVSAVGMLAFSTAASVTMGTGSESLFHGRYVDVVAPLLILVALGTLVDADRSSLRRWLAAIVSVQLLLAAAVVALHGGWFVPGGIDGSNITGVLPAVPSRGGVAVGRLVAFGLLGSTAVVAGFTMRRWVGVATLSVLLALTSLFGLRWYVYPSTQRQAAHMVVPAAVQRIDRAVGLPAGCVAFDVRTDPFMLGHYRYHLPGVRLLPAGAPAADPCQLVVTPAGDRAGTWAGAVRVAREYDDRADLVVRAGEFADRLVTGGLASPGEPRAPRPGTGGHR